MGATHPLHCLLQAIAARRGWGMPSFLKSTRKMAFAMLAVCLAFVSPADARVYRVNGSAVVSGDVAGLVTENDPDLESLVRFRPARFRALEERAEKNKS